MDPVQIGSKFYNSSGPTYANTIIKPADNVNGVVIRTGTFSGSPNSLVSTGTSAPTGVTDITKPLVGKILTTGQVVTLPYPIYLPAGYGLWDHGNNQVMGCAFTYDFL